MREHPIPQDVTGYKFHIVGNMTLKQFAEVAVGVVIAVILYNTNLLVFIKWPLMILAVSFGGMLAFVPIGERPFSHWVTTFFKRLYHPTKFYWKKKDEVPFSFTYEKPSDQPKNADIEIDLSPARRNRIKEYLESVKTHQKKIEPWEQAEQDRISTVLQAFEEVEVKNVSAKPQKIKPKLVPRVRNLSSHNAPDIGAKKDIEAQKQETVFEQPLEELIKQTPEPAVETEPAVEKVEEIIEEIITKPEEKNPPELIQPIELVVPEEPEIPITTPDPNPVPTTVVQEQPILEDQVKSNKTLPFPDPPTQPNKIVGMVLTHDEKLVDRANIVIFDQNGNVIRSVKSNLLGQFFVTGTLPNGTFTIDTKKQGMEFTQQQLALSGQVVEPLEIRASA